VVVVSILGALQPALVLLVSQPLFGEAVDARTAAWTGVALLGTTLVVAGGAHLPGWSPLGDLVAVANLLSFTTYFLASKHLRGGVGTIEYVGGMTTTAAIVVGATALLRGEPIATVGARDLSLLAFVAFVPGTLGHLLVNWAHPYAPAVLTSVLLLGVPVLATAGAWWVLGEPVAPLQVVGGATVLLAVGRLVIAPAPREALAEAAAETDAP